MHDPSWRSVSQPLDDGRNAPVPYRLACFHKFVFLAVEFESTNSPGAGTSDLANILASSLYPATATPFPVIGYQGDTAEFVRIETTGGIKLFHATNLSHTSWIATINGFYKIV